MFRSSLLVGSRAPFAARAIPASRPRLATLGLLAILSGCASTSPKAAFDAVAANVRVLTGVDLRWARSDAESAQTQQLVRNLLSEPLDAAGAARLALLNNPRLQGELEELGIAQADLAQATRIANPSVDAFVRQPRGGGAANVELSVAEDLLDVLVQPLRRRLGEAALEETKLRVADALLRASAGAKTALFTLQGSEQLLARLGTIAQVQLAAFELARRQQAAGNISELDLANHQALYEESRLEVVQARARVDVDRETLNRELGLAEASPSYRVLDSLPPLPLADPPAAGLETLAMDQRLDIAAGRRAIDVVGRALALEKSTRFLPAGVEVGVSRERDSARTVVAGPTLRLRLPVFDTGAAATARLEAQHRQSQCQLDALAVRVRSEVRAAASLLASARERTRDYERIVLPLRARILEQTLQHYNSMLKGAYDVLLARQQELDAEKAYIAAWRDYWLARVELERAVGGRLPEAEPAKASTDAAPATLVSAAGSPGGRR